MLAHSVRPSTSLLVPARGWKNSHRASHLICRHSSKVTFLRADAATAKVIKALILQVNAHPSFSAEYKHRTSRRLFAQLDYCTASIELAALRARGRQLLPRVQQMMSRGGANESNARMQTLTEELRAAHRQLAAARWDAFRLHVFAPRGDVELKERLQQVPLFILNATFCRLGRLLLCGVAACLRVLINQGMRDMDLELRFG